MTRSPALRRCWINGDVSNERFHGSSRVRSTSFEDRPTVALLGDRRSPQRIACPVQCGGRRTRRDQDTRHTGTAGAFDGDVAGVPRRRSFLLQRLVVLVEHHDRSHARRTATTPRCGRRSPRRRLRRRAPTGRDARRSSSRTGGGGRPGAAPRRPTDGSTSVGPSANASTSDRHLIGGRWESDQARKRTVDDAVARFETSMAAARRPSPAGCAATRNGRNRPAPQRMRRPAGEVDDLSRRPDARPFRQRHEPLDRHRTVGRPRPTTQPPTRRPCNGTRTIDPTATRARRGSGTR